MPLDNLIFYTLKGGFEFLVLGFFNVESICETCDICLSYTNTIFEHNRKLTIWVGEP